MEAWEWISLLFLWVNSLNAGLRVPVHVMRNFPADSFCILRDWTHLRHAMKRVWCCQRGTVQVDGMLFIINEYVATSVLCPGRGPVFLFCMLFRYVCYACWWHGALHRRVPPPTAPRPAPPALEAATAEITAACLPSKPCIHSPPRKSGSRPTTKLPPVS